MLCHQKSGDFVSCRQSSITQFSSSCGFGNNKAQIEDIHSKQQPSQLPWQPYTAILATTTAAALALNVYFRKKKTAGKLPCFAKSSAWIGWWFAVEPWLENFKIAVLSRVWPPNSAAQLPWDGIKSKYLRKASSSSWSFLFIIFVENRIVSC